MSWVHGDRRKRVIRLCFMNLIAPAFLLTYLFRRLVRSYFIIVQEARG